MYRLLWRAAENQYLLHKLVSQIMRLSDLIIYILIGANALVFFMQCKQYGLLDKIVMSVRKVRYHKEYYRIFSSAFGHVSLLHIALNMFVLYSFYRGFFPDSNTVSFQYLQTYLGGINIFQFILIYAAGIVGCSLYVLWMRWEDPSYSAVGASGAVSGVLFAFAYLFPFSKMQLIILPIPMSSWIFTALFTIVSLILSQLPKAQGIVSHEGHLGGGLFGHLAAIALWPEIFLEYPIYSLVTLVPILLFILIRWLQPNLLYRYLR